MTNEQQTPMQPPVSPYKHKNVRQILETAKLFLECNLLAGSWNQHLTPHGIQCVIDPQLCPTGIIAMPIGAPLGKVEPSSAESISEEQLKARDEDLN